MSYIDNLAGVYQTKLDALNDMDRFRQVSELAKGSTPETSRDRAASDGGSSGLLISAGIAVLAGVTLWLLDRSKTPKASDGGTGNNGPQEG